MKRPRLPFSQRPVIAFLHQHCGDALAAVERQLHLAQIHVAVQGQLGAVAVTAHEPPQRRHDDDDKDDSAGEKESESRHLWHAVTCFRQS